MAAFIISRYTINRFAFSFYIAFCAFTIISKIPKKKVFFQVILYKTKLIEEIKNINTTKFSVDIVYTWVDGRDPKWLSEFSKAKKENKISICKTNFLNRYVDIEEMRYSLRSVEKYVPWINNIFILTWDQQPDWINIHHPKIKFISHSQIFPPNTTLPTFNSKSIDFLLYRIPGLSEHFIYVNDDMYFGRPATLSDFFTPDGKSIIISDTATWSNVGFYNKEYKYKEKFSKNHHYLYDATVTNTIIIFKQKYNIIFPYKYSHIPFPLTKTICKEVYSNFKEQIDNVINNRFRTTDDLQM